MSSRIVACVLAAAGAVVGMSGVAAAQGAAGGVSRPRVVVKELRGEGQEQAEREAKRELRVYVEGQEAGKREAQVKRRAEVQARAKAQAAQERAVVVQKRLQGGGDVCEHCGRSGPRDGRSDGGGESKRTIERVIRLGEGGGSQGQAIVIGPDGERHEFKFGGEGQGQWRAIQGEGAKKQRVELRALGGGGQGGWTEFGAPQKMEMDEVHKHLRMHLDGLGDKIDGQVRKEIELKMRGGQGPHSVTLFGEEGGPGHEGHVVIIGPDGERREWRTGGHGGAHGGGDVQIFEFRDGEGAQGHLFKQPLTRPGAKGQKAEPKRIQLRPARPMNVI